MVSVGRPSGALTQRIWPDDLSKLMKRCAPPANWPQENVSPLTITWFPSTIGDDIAPAVRRPHAELFGERAFPEHLAVARQRHHQAVAADREHVAGCRIDRGRRPGDAVRRHVTGEDVVAVFPEQLAGIRVEAQQSLLLGCARPTVF